MGDAGDELAERRHFLRLEELELRFLKLPKIGEPLIGDGNSVGELSQRCDVVFFRLFGVGASHEYGAVRKRYGHDPSPLRPLGMCTLGFYVVGELVRIESKHAHPTFLPGVDELLHCGHLVRRQVPGFETHPPRER